MSINKAILVGNVGNEPKIQTYSNGNVAQFPLATTERGYTLKNGTQVPDRTEWHNLIAWGKTADVIAKYVHKGSKLYIEGKIKTRSYDDNQGRKCYVTEIHVDVMELLDPKPSNSNQSNNGNDITF
jgi:single-strand DNA-binding protein